MIEQKISKLFDNLSYKSIESLEQIKESAIIDSSALFLYNEEINNILKEKDIILFNDTDGFKRTIEDLEKIQNYTNKFDNLKSISKIETNIKNTLNEKNIFNFEKVNNLFIEKYNKELNGIYNHFKTELEKISTFNISGRIVNVKDYIKVLEMGEKDGTERYNIIDRINQLISAIILNSVNNIIRDNNDIFTYYLNIETNIDLKEIEEIKKDLINLDLIKLVFLKSYYNLINISNAFMTKDERFNIFNSFFENIKERIEKTFKDLELFKILSEVEIQELNVFINNIEKISENEVNYLNEIYQKYPFLINVIEKVNTIVENNTINDFVIMINKFQNKLFFSFFEFKNDYRKNLFIYLFQILKQKTLKNYTLSFWDERIFFDFLIKFIQ